MSSNNRRKKQVSLYLEGWLKSMAEERATSSGSTFTGYIQDLIREDLGLAPDYKPKEVVITYLPDGVVYYDVNQSEVGNELSE